MAFSCEDYAEVRLRGLSVRSKNSSTRSLAKRDPRSALIIFGERNRPKWASKHPLADWALASLRQNISRGGVNYDKNILFVREWTYIDNIQSVGNCMCRSWKMSCVDLCINRTQFLTAWTVSYDERTCCFIFFHTWLRLNNRVRVRSTPLWPTIALWHIWM